MTDKTATSTPLTDARNRILHTAQMWADQRDVGPTPAKEAWADLTRRIDAEINAAVAGAKLEAGWADACRVHLPTGTAAERAEFEDIFNRLGVDVTPNGACGYADPRVNAAWMAWRRPAARPSACPSATHYLGMSTTSDGSTASYYELPAGATELQHLISHRDMNAQVGEIFRACYRYGIACHSDKLRDAKKIKFYAQAEIERLEGRPTASSAASAAPAPAPALSADLVAIKWNEFERTDDSWHPFPYQRLAQWAFQEGQKAATKEQ